MILQEWNAQEIRAKLNDWAAKKQANPNYNRAYRAMDEDKLTAYMIEALRDPVKYKSIILVLMQEMDDRINHRTVKSAVYPTGLTNYINQAKNVLAATDEFAQFIKQVEAFEQSNDFKHLQSTYEQAEIKLIHDCYHIKTFINDRPSIMGSLGYTASTLNAIRRFLEKLRKDSGYKMYDVLKLYDSANSKLDFSNINSSLVNLYTRFYQFYYYNLLIFLKVLDFVVEKGWVKENNVNVWLYGDSFAGLSCKITDSSLDIAYLTLDLLPADVIKQTYDENDLKDFLNGNFQKTSLQVGWNYYYGFTFDYKNVQQSFTDLIKLIKTKGNW